MIHSMENGVAAAAVPSDSFADSRVEAGQDRRIGVTDVQSSTVSPTTVTGGYDKTAIVYAGDYLNKLSGESVERECRRKINEGATEVVVNFSKTEIVNSIGVSILLGVIDVASSNGARVVFSDVNENTAELFEMLGLTNHVVIRPA